jgi:cytochrome c peroxidase
LLREHDEISRATFAGPEIGSRANCVACHQGAEHGDFSEDDVRIPKRKELK